MAAEDDIGRRLLEAELGAVAFAAACVRTDGEVIYEDGEPKGEGVPERYAIDYEQFVAPEGMFDRFESAPPSTKLELLDVATAFVADQPERVEGIVPYLARCLMLRPHSVRFESVAIEFIEKYTEYVRKEGAELPRGVAETVPILVRRLDNSSGVGSHEKYGGALLHIERVAPGVLVPYLDVFVHPSHNRGERRIHMPSPAMGSNPEGALRAFERAVERIVDRRTGSVDEGALAEDMTAVKQLVNDLLHGEVEGALMERMHGLVRSVSTPVAATTDSREVREVALEVEEMLGETKET